MTGELFNPEAFEQMPGQMSMADVAENPRTWDGEPMFSPESVKEARELEPLPGESPEDTARWARIFAKAALQPPSTPGNNVWD